MQNLHTYATFAAGRTRSIMATSPEEALSFFRNIDPLINPADIRPVNADYWKSYRERSSQMGKIVTKSGRLIVGSKTHLSETFVRIKRGYSKTITSKYFDKGNLTEQDGIDLLNRNLYPNHFIKKNDRTYFNNFITGTPDAISPDGIVWDIKSAWDWETFEKADLTHNYEWQIKAYCWLLGTTRGRLIYCLNNMPDAMIDDQERQLFYAGQFPTKESEHYAAARKELEARFKYDHVSDLERFKVWDIFLTEEDIAKMESAVIQSREFLQAKEQEILDLIETNKSLVYAGGAIPQKEIPAPEAKPAIQSFTKEKNTDDYELPF